VRVEAGGVGAAVPLQTRFQAAIIIFITIFSSRRCDAGSGRLLKQRPKDGLDVLVVLSGNFEKRLVDTLRPTPVTRFLHGDQPRRRKVALVGRNDARQVLVVGPLLAYLIPQLLHLQE